MAGNVHSNRWGSRKAVIEECEQKRASHCDACGKRIKIAFRPPLFKFDSPLGQAWGCRSCHKLGYASDTLKSRSTAAKVASDAAGLAIEVARLDQLRSEARWARSMIENVQNGAELSREMRKWCVEIQRAYGLQLALVVRAEQLAALESKRRTYRLSEMGCRYGRKRRDEPPVAAPVADEKEPLVVEELPENLLEQILEWASASQKKRD